VCQSLSTTVSQLFESQLQKNRHFYVPRPSFFCLPWERPCGNHAKHCMNEKTIQCLQTPRSMYPSCTIYLEQFPSYSSRKCEKSPVFTYRSPHFCFPWRRPCDYQFNACQTPRIMYPSIFNSFPVIRTAIAKTSRFHVPQPTFLFPLETPLRLSPNMFHGWKDNSMLAKPLGKTRMARLPHGEKFRRYLYSFWRNSRT